MLSQTQDPSCIVLELYKLTLKKTHQIPGEAFPVLK